VGFRGYSGAELVRILERHPQVRPVLMEHRSDSGGTPQPLNWTGPQVIGCTPEAVQKESIAVVFLATPAEVSMELAPAFLEAGARVVDLSGAFRLGTAEAYKRWYGAEHTSLKWLGEAVYGLPEFCRERIPTARLVANPGCYPTAANLALRPLLEADVIDRRAGIVCDAKSGVSGAGRKPAMKTSFCEVTDNFSAYSILNHRHVPEVLMTSGLEEHEFSFTAQLIPIDRGILETIYFRGKLIQNSETLLGIYLGAYLHEPFVRVHPVGSIPDIHGVARTNFCDIGAVYDSATGRGVVVVAIDNLTKGAAGMAVQNMNLMLGFAETEGLP
jgi:N-acetyl-gamma-glutamyl-phosphate reductase